MGLDATVYCNCYKTGNVKSPPPYPELVEIDTNGGTYISTDDNDKYFEFENWKRTACVHEEMVLIHYRLGNISAIGHIKNNIEEIALKEGHFFPILLTKVIYSGFHAGDQLDLPDIEILVSEISILKKYADGDVLTQNILNELSDLCEKAMHVQNSIVF